MAAILKKILTILLFFTAACEEINDVEIEIGHKEFIVIQAELKNGYLFQGVSITRTLPLGESFDIKKAEVKDAEVYLLINGVQVVPIHYTQDGIYKPLDNLLIKSRNTYELFAKADGKEIYSKTKVPSRPEPDNVVFEEDYVWASIFPKPDEVYGAAWIIQSNAASVISKAEDFYSITQPLNVSTSSEIIVRTQNITEKYNNENFRSLTYIKLYSFDKPYYEFFKSRNNSRPIDNSITQGGGAVAWNVYGENVIGLFIGISEGDLIKAN
jgi:hypothetical protein